MESLLQSLCTEHSEGEDVSHQPHRGHHHQYHTLHQEGECGQPAIRQRYFKHFSKSKEIIFLKVIILHLAIAWVHAKPKHSSKGRLQKEKKKLYLGIWPHLILGILNSCFYFILHICSIGPERCFKINMSFPLFGTPTRLIFCNETLSNSKWYKKT